MLAMPIAGQLADRTGVGRIVPFGLLTIIAAVAGLTQVTAHTSYVVTSGILFVFGIGMGFTMMPTFTGAIQVMRRAAVARATTALNIIQQTGASIGTAVLSVVLASALTDRLGARVSRTPAAYSFSWSSANSKPTLDGMKRDPALASLSRDHHLALFAAQKLRRATAETAAEARTGLLDYLAEHGREHFREEEEILLPAFAEHGDPHHPLVARALCEHVDVRHRAGRIERNAESPLEELHELGELLAAHVRFEERELFGLIEEALPPDELAALAAALDHPGSA